ncbi:MAG: hypothetical protein V4857_30620 [Pseudomonadota bacterium]
MIEVLIRDVERRPAGPRGMGARGQAAAQAPGRSLLRLSNICTSKPARRNLHVENGPVVRLAAGQPVSKRKPGIAQSTGQFNNSKQKRHINLIDFIKR